MIYIECKPDLVLVKSLTNVPKREVVHAGNKGGVCNQLRKRKNCTGMVDEDPSSRQPRYLRAAQPGGDFPEYDLRMLYDSANNNYLIVLCPDLEGWIFKTTREVGIDLRRHNLPNDATGLYRVINIALDKFASLLADPKLKGSSRLKTLKSLLERG